MSDALSTNDERELAPEKSSEPELRGRARTFADLVLQGKSAAEAYRLAGFKAKDGDVAASLAYRLIRKDQVAKYLTEKQAEMAERADLEILRVVIELKRILTADVGESFDAKGALKPLKDWPEDLRRALSGIDVEELFGAEGDGGQRAVIGRVVKVKYWSKTDAANLLLKRFPGGFAPERQEHTVKVQGLAERMSRARSRARGGR